MAAILCKVCFVEPCKAMAKCCEGCCECLGSCCDCFAKCIGSCCKGFESCCDFISTCCEKPFSGCLFTSVLINFIALLYGIIAIVNGGSQCDKPLLILAIVLLICALLNAGFSYYMYRTVNYDKHNPLFNQSDMKPSQKLYAFFKYDKWMAVYIIFILILIALLVVSIVMAGSCSSQIGTGVFWVSVIIFIYLGVAMLILFSYVAFDAFKEWAHCCPCWLIPVCWPCLIVGCCLNCADDLGLKSEDNSRGNTNDNGRTNAYNAPVEQQTAQAPVVVVQQPPQQVVYAQPVQPQQVVYTQPQAPVQQYVVTQPANIAQTQPQSGYNPNSNAIQPGVLVVQQPQPVAQQQMGASEEKGPGNEVDYKQEAKQVAQAAGKQAKKAGIAALGWMTKKMNDMNDKAQEKEDKDGKGVSEGAEGNQNQNTY